MWVLIDNYDSFTHILYHYLLQTGNECVIFRNDVTSLSAIDALEPHCVILSPGPGTPQQSGITMAAIHHFHNRVPILGVCLGHQALGMYFGAQLTHAHAPMHGKTSEVVHNHHCLFQGIPSPFTAMRYHSLVIEGLSQTMLQAIATTTDGVNMAIAHPVFPSIGVQFHPESVGTAYGQQIINNWSEFVRKVRQPINC